MPNSKCHIYMFKDKRYVTLEQNFLCEITTERNCTSYPFIHQKIPFFQINLGSCLSGIYLRNSHCQWPWNIYFRILYVLKKEAGTETVLGLDYTLKTCKPCSCPASRAKKEPRDSDKDFNSVLDRGSHVSKAKDPGVTPTEAAGRQTPQPSSPLSRAGGYHL